MPRLVLLGLLGLAALVALVILLAWSIRRRRRAKALTRHEELQAALTASQGREAALRVLLKLADTHPSSEDLLTLRALLREAPPRIPILGATVLVLEVRNIAALRSRFAPAVVNTLLRNIGGHLVTRYPGALIARDGDLLLAVLVPALPHKDLPSLIPLLENASRPADGSFELHLSWGDTNLGPGADLAAALDKARRVMANPVHAHTGAWAQVTPEAGHTVRAGSRQS